MAFVLTTDFLAAIRQADDDTLNPVAARCIASAEEHVEQFIGTALADLLDDASNIPAPLYSAVCILAQIEFDAVEPDREQTMLARAEGLMRPFRVELGFGGA